MTVFQTILIFISSLFINANDFSLTEFIDSKLYFFDIDSTRLKAEEAFNYCQSKNMNEDICILIDMSIHSGRKRFFLWDFKKDTIQYDFLVSHGCGENPWNRDLSKDCPEFSNIDGSHLSSLGKYKIGERGYSNWGININYKLYGLDSSNSNAFNRLIVLHSWEAITDEEIYPNGSSEGWGCPAISNISLKLIDPLLKASAKPVLLWIYN